MTTTPTITFFGGIGTIGGTKIAVAEGDHRVIFDFGTHFAPSGDFWGGPVQPRRGAAGLRDYIALGYLPAIDGLYRPDQVAGLGLAPGQGEQTQVFISHLHLDHMAVLDRLADAVPVWMHEQSLRLLRATGETGERPAVPADARPFRAGERITVGPLGVTPLAVDHDIPGAVGLLIETGAGAVVYTGDLRLHGTAAEANRLFLAQARAARPQILLIEGTRLGEPRPGPGRPAHLTEAAVPGRVAELLQPVTGLGLITLYPRNTDRIARIAAAAAQVGRQLVLSPEAAHIYQAMGHSLAPVAVYRRARDQMALAGETAAPWLRALLEGPTAVVDATALRAAPGRYLLQLFLRDLPELTDLSPPAGSLMIHSNGEPLGRFDPAFALFTRWLERFGIGLAYAPASGHATPADLRQIARAIKPAVLMPIHSLRPEALKVAGLRRVLPELGATYAVATGERIS